MVKSNTRSRIYDGEGDRLMQQAEGVDRIILLPDSTGREAMPAATNRMRIMWGQNLLEDILAGHYRTLVCSVNPFDNSRGIISQVAKLLTTSQWDEAAITAHAKRFMDRGAVTVIKYDMDKVEVLALLRPSKLEHLRMEDLAQGFKMATEMIKSKTERTPAASVSFLGGRANKLVDAKDTEPTFETVLRTMFEAGFAGDVYPAPWMWTASPIGVFARYPFPASLSKMREGGF